MQNPGSCHWLELTDFLSTSHRSGEDKEIWGISSLAAICTPCYDGAGHHRNSGCLPSAAAGGTLRAAQAALLCRLWSAEIKRTTWIIQTLLAFAFPTFLAWKELRKWLNVHKSFKKVLILNVFHHISSRTYHQSLKVEQQCISKRSIQRCQR